MVVGNLVFFNRQTYPNLTRLVVTFVVILTPERRLTQGYPQKPEEIKMVRTAGFEPT